ncbi:MAG: hypothetical protein JO057_03655 [Chloroflexi bacterium]|nr:hypothetical protein [Chloroflexota bacterium]
MGLPFRSGHVLALRRFPASSIGPAYRSIWHRDPDGRWSFLQDVAPDNACTRYFGSAGDEVMSATIDIHWNTPTAFTVTAVGGPHRLDWSVVLSSSVTTRLLNVVGSVLPESWWQNRWLLSSMETVAGRLLHAGELHFTGQTPNAQHFTFLPLQVWLVADSAATLDGVQLGKIGAAPIQGALGDFRTPQRGVFATGRAFFQV